ncbi:Histone-binding protein rbbp4 [Mitosporidium daphniae]
MMMSSSGTQVAPGNAPPSVQEAERLMINEEYKIWKKNAPFLYDVIITHALEWPSLTVEWLPDMELQREKGVAVQRLVLGTHTSGGEQNYLQLASVILPLEMEQPDTRKASGEPEMGGYGASPDCRILITQRILHEGEVNRARVMPQNPCLIATRTVSGPVHVWDYTKHPSKPKDDVVRPDIVLSGHTREGYGLSWNPQRTGHLVTCGEDQKVMLWDVASASKENLALDPLVTFEGGHTEVVEDVAWNLMNGTSTIVSVGDDKKIIFWDPRAPKPTAIITNAHKGEINCVSFSPMEEHFFVTGSADRTVALWDARRCSSVDDRLHSFEIHADDVLQVSWSSHRKGVFASGGADRRLNVWDVSRIGADQSEEDAADGPPELLFVHGGHTSKISDFSWNSNDPWTICSASEDNLLQIWKMSSEIYEGGDETDEEGSYEEAADEEDRDDDNQCLGPAESEMKRQLERSNNQEGLHFETLGETSIFHKKEAAQQIQEDDFDSFSSSVPSAIPDSKASHSTEGVDSGFSPQTKAEDAILKEEEDSPHPKRHALEEDILNYPTDRKDHPDAE